MDLLTYGVIFVILFILELLYFRIADKCNIIDKPNERSSHSTIVLRGGGIIFMLGLWIWAAFYGFGYPWFVVAVTLTLTCLTTSWGGRFFYLTRPLLLGEAPPPS